MKRSKVRLSPKLQKMLKIESKYVRKALDLDVAPCYTNNREKEALGADAAKVVAEHVVEPLD